MTLERGTRLGPYANRYPARSADRSKGDVASVLGGMQRIRAELVTSMFWINRSGRIYTWAWKGL